MISYTVHEPPNPPADRIARAAGITFVREGFGWTAAFLTPFWMLAHRLWWPLLAYVVAIAALDLVRQTLTMNPEWLALASLALSLGIGLEAAALRRWDLDRRGWATLGAVSGRTAEECERRFFEAWLPAQPRTSDEPRNGDARRSVPGAPHPAPA